MAVFTAIASVITGIISGAGFSAAFAAATSLATGVTALGVATSLVAGGLALATAKALGPDVPSIQAAKDPGVKVQLDPSTDNRVPVFYGRVFTGSIAVDAEIKNQNNTMVYVMVIGEKTDTGTYTVNDIYRGDAKLNFTGATVTSITDPNATSSTNVNGKMRCRVYAGNAQSSVNQIFPTTGKVAAQTLCSTIDTTTNYEDLVYAIFELDYDPENGLTGLGQLTFDITNSLNSPANVLYDYMTNNRYGAGIPVSSIDTDSIDDMWDYSNINGAYGNVEYTTTANVSAYHSRWQIDGVLSTYQPVKDNIDRICTSSSTFFTYDPKGGKFKTVPNREATAGEKSAAFVFNNDNIISKIEIGSTELYSYYNSIEAEYPAVNQKDQTSTVIVETPAGDRQANEPDNGLNIRYDLINDAPRAKNLANLDLRQSRFDTVVTFDADYSAIQVDVGDIVKLTESTYGFNEKLFRVMRVTEKEDESGMLAVKVVALEYDDSVYTHEVVQSLAPENAPGIPNWWTGIYGNVDYGNISNIINGNIIVIDDPLGGNANVVDDTGNIVGNVNIPDSNVVYPPFTPPGGPIINVPITIPEIPDITTICTNLYNMKIAGTLPANVDFGHICVDHVPPDGNATFPPGGNVTVPIPIPEPPTIDPTNPITPIIPEFEFDLDIWFGNDIGNQTAVSTVPGIPITYKGGAQTFGAVQTGVQEEESAANLAMANADTFVGNIDLGDANSIIVPVTSISLGGINEGIFTATNNFIPFGGAQTNGTLAYAAEREVEYKEYDIDATTGKWTPSANSDIYETFSGNGFYTQFSSEAPPTNISDNFEYEISRERGSALAVSLGLPPASATKAYLANNLNVVHYANSNLTNVGVRGASVTNHDKRITKGDDYLQLF
jgi:hypothetical protein